MDLATVLNLITTLTVILGVVFGLIQLRQYQRDRKREGALLVVHSLQTREFLAGLNELLAIPDGLGKPALEQLVGDVIGKIHLVTATWERVGILVFHRELPLDVVDDAFSGPIMVSWKKLEQYVHDLRAEQNRETWLEWFQWLAERMMDRESDAPPTPAFIAHKDWES
jgi:hypothetical protein